MIILEAAKLIILIYKDTPKGMKEKKKFDQNIGLHEAFLESVPTAFITTVLISRAIGREGSEIEKNQVEWNSTPKTCYLYSLVTNSNNNIQLVCPSEMIVTTSVPQSY